MPGNVHPLLGRYHVAEPPSTMLSLHFHRGGTLREVDHEPKVAVLDQSDLLAQGIRTSQLIMGCSEDFPALGSCVFNSATEALSNLFDETVFEQVTTSTGYTDTKGAEEFAIGLYHSTTDLTGDPSTEWPPTDCGSSGLFVTKQLIAEGTIRSAKVAAGAENVISLMQDNGVIVGQPWFNSWFQPDTDGFIDGDGSPEALEQAIASGVAGGHETYWSAVEKLTLDKLGRVDPANTVIRFRNHWTPSWGDHGSARVHLSTYVMLQQHCDWRRLIA